MRVISCNAHYYIYKEKQVQSTKFRNRSNIGILIRYKGNTIYWIYNLERGVIQALAVVFKEDSTLAILTTVKNNNSNLEPYKLKARPLKETVGNPIAITYKNNRELLNPNARSVNEDTIIV